MQCDFLHTPTVVYARNHIVRIEIPSCTIHVNIKLNIIFSIFMASILELYAGFLYFPDYFKLCKTLLSLETEITLG